jgi:hypothetical protein
METPVIYFYAADQTDVSVKVRFRKGLITEWFPRAAVTPGKFPETAADTGRGLPDVEGTASWQRVRVQPRASDNFPVETAGSHYYAARATDAAPIAVGPDKEKFIFYRGVAAFAPPISATVAADGKIIVKSSARSAVGDVVLFENRGGKTTFQVRRATGQEITLNPQVTTGTAPESLKPLVEKILVGNGLYPREAQAMIATWGDSWFEEGARLFYIAPRSFVDSILPLDVKPGASEMARVFVGRIELVTRATLSEVKDGLLRHDLETLNKYGRFLEPIADRVQAESTDEEQGRMARARQSLRMSWRAPLSGCR